MCADNFADRKSRRHAGRRRTHSGPQRHPVEAVALFKGGPASGAVPPPSRSTYYVGRVGALAVALGVGTAILGFSGAATADTGTGDTAGSPGRESSAGESGNRGSAARAGNGRSARSDRVDSAVAPESAESAESVRLPGTASDNGNSGGQPVRSGRGSIGLPAGTAGSGPATRNGGLPTGTKPSADLSILGTLLTPGGVQNLLQESLTSFIGNLLSGTTPGDAVAPPGVLSVTAAAPEVTAVAPAPEPPAMTAAAQPDVLDSAQGDALSALGGDSDGLPLATPLAWAAVAVSRRDEVGGPSPEVAPAAAVTTGETADPALADAEAAPDSGDPATVEFAPDTGAAVEPTIPQLDVATTETTDPASDPAAPATGDVAAGATFDVPPKPPGCTSPVCDTLAGVARGIISNKIAEAVIALVPQAALGPDGQPALGCGTGKGNAGSGKCGVSPANYIAAYSFNIITALMGGSGLNVKPLPDTTVGATVQQFFSQPQILTFISQTVASNLEKSFSSPLGTVPPGVANTVGNAVATLLQDSFGTSAVANALVPFLRAINLPYKTAPATNFAIAAQKDLFAAILKQLGQDPFGDKPTVAPTISMRDALTAFFKSDTVQDAFEAAVTQSIDVLLGQASASWTGAPQVPSTAVADYIGDVAADAVLGPDNPSTAALATTIGSAVEGLFSSIGGIVASDSGAALGAFLNAPEQNVPTTLSTFIVNGFVGFLQNGAGQTVDPPFPQQPLLPSLSGAAGIAVSGLVNSLLSNPLVEGGLGAFITQVVPGVLGNAGVQGLIGDLVANVVTAQLPEPLGQVVGPQVGAAVADLLANPVVGEALTTFVNTALGDLLGAPGVVSALADAAGTLAASALDPGPIPILPEVIAALRVNPAIDGAVQAAVTDAVGQLLSDTGLWQVVDGQLTALVVELLGDEPVQAAVADWVAAAVNERLGFGPISVVGDQVGAVVVALITNPVVQAGLVGVVDTLVADFFGTAGVVGVFSQAAGVVARAAVVGDLDTVLPQVQAAVRGNADVQAGVQTAVVDAVAAFLGDGAVWAAVDQTLSAAVVALTGDPVVLDAIAGAVSDQVVAALGEPLGQVVGPQVGDAVVALVSDPAVVEALLGVAGTVFGDFIGAFGVVPAVSDAAGEVALALLGGASVAEAISAAGQELATSPAIDNAVAESVSAAVAELLGDTAVVDALGGAVGVLVSDLVAEPVVQQYAGDALAALVTGFLGESPIAVPVGQAIGAAAVQFLATPAVAAGLGVVIGSVLPDFVDQSGVPGAVADVIGQFAEEVLKGEDPRTALGTALEALRTSSVIQAALKITIADALNLVDTAILGVPAIQQEIGTIVTELITGLAGNPTVRTFIAASVGPPLGPVVANLLANTAVVGEAAVALGSAVTQLLNYPGFDTALTGAVDQFIDLVLDGTAPTDALGIALQSLQSAPAFTAAVEAVIPGLLNSILAYPNVRRAIGDVAKEATIAQLKESGIENQFVDGVAGQVVGGTVTSFLGTRAGDRLIDNVVLNVLEGMPLADVTAFATEQVIRDPLLQIALGMSIGQGIGSLFGDNIVADFIGLVAGLPITVVVIVTAGIASIYQWIFGGPNLGASQTAQAILIDNEVPRPLPAAADVYAVNAIIPPGWQDTVPSREALVADAQFTLTSMSLTAHDDDQPVSVDITMTVGAADAQADGQVPALRAAFRLRLDRLVLTAESTSQTVASGRRYESRNPMPPAATV